VPSPQPMILLLHEGELEDVRALLDRMAVAYVEWRGSSTRVYEQSAWGLVIATPQRFAAADFGAAGRRPAGIAILDQESRPLGALLGRSGVDYLVRRPVHAAALRLLILRLLYQGPERRGALRVSVGFPVELRAPLRWRPAYLLDLSLLGCRLLSSRAAGFGRRASVRLPSALTGGRDLVLGGHISRVGPCEEGEAGAEEIAVRFGALPTRELRALEALLGQLSEAPGLFEADGEGSPAAADAAGAGPAAREPEAPAGERRRRDRRAYPLRVIALGNEPARVVLGRDLSAGGMRIEPTEKLSLGEELRLALHIGAEREPLVVGARVERDDGAEGLMLRFEELPPEAAAHLAGMLDCLPVMSSLGEGEEGVPLVVSEILPGARADGEPGTPAP